MISQTEDIIINKANMFNNIYNQTLIVLMLTGFCWLLYQSGLLLIWLTDEEYGHGFMVIGLLAYILYRNRESLKLLCKSSHWVGSIISFVALLLFILGDMSGIVIIRMYSIWFFVIAAVFAIGGWRLFRKLFIPVLIVFLLIPLPNLVSSLLTAELQLISSNIGVWVIRLFGGVVFLEGNVIDMGGVKLLVAEACAGLRYLFPLMSIGAIAGYLMHAPLWMRWTLFIVTIPITILMNSFRIGVTGLLTEIYGSSHTEGFLHFFEGWIVFVASLSILLILAWVMLKSVPGSPSLDKAFSFELVFSNNDKADNDKTQLWQHRYVTNIMLLSLLATVVVSILSTDRNIKIISNTSLSQFPEQLGEWRATESRLLPSIEAVAGASEYYYGDFFSSTGGKVNLYIAYYHDQKKGVAPHSPTVCIPGDGWVIKSDEKLQLQSKNNTTIDVSRLLISKGNKKIITYYWLKQGSKVFYQQLMARLDLVRYVIQENRSDAALIRMVSEVESDEDIKDTDLRMQRMAKELLSVVSDYIPD